MINFLINDSAIRQTLPVLKTMLKNDQDDVLLLAHGYMDSRTMDGLNIQQWLSGRSDRRIILLVGVHGQGDIGFHNSNLEKLERTIDAVFHSWRLPNDGAERVLLYAVEHFHAKFAATGIFERDGEMAKAFTLDEKRPLSFSPKEVVLGSSNLTQAALSGPNIELDIHIPRGSAQELGDFASKMHTVLSRAILAANELGSFSNVSTEELRGYLERRLGDLAAQRARINERDMMEYSLRLERDLMDPDR